jgi:hypothetical protein
VAIDLDLQSRDVRLSRGQRAGYDCTLPLELGGTRTSAGVALALGRDKRIGRVT